MTFFALFLIVAMIVLIIGWISVEWREEAERNRLDYERNYDVITQLLNDLPVNRENYDRLFGLLGQLGSMKYDNIEKTSVLIYRFKTKYANERIAIELKKL